MGYVGTPEILVLIIIGFIIFIIVKVPKDIPIIFSHWYHLIDNMQASSQQYYALIERNITDRQLPDTTVSRANHAEGGMFSANREYLRVTRKDYTFDICAAPFARGFFISWWLGEDIGPFLDLVRVIPFIGPRLVRIFRPETYYRSDTALMFQESVHASVLEVLDETIKTQGLRSLSELERKPILKNFFKR